MEQCIPFVASVLPFTEDVEEADYVYTFLCDRMDEYV